MARLCYPQLLNDNMYIPCEYSFEMNPFCHVSKKIIFVCFVALRPKSTAMVIAGRSVHLTTLFPGQA